MIYIDNAATTKMSAEVLGAMAPYLADGFGNPNSKHVLGRGAYAAVEMAREQVADFLNANPQQIIFTSSGSEANTLAICGLLEYLRSVGRTKILVSCVEHQSVLRSAESMIKHGFDVQFLPVNEFGAVELATVMRSLDDKTGLISVMRVNNELGTENRVFEICELAHNAGALFHTDCVQAASCMPIDCREMDCDFLTISGHKIFGPKGVGVLYAKDKGVLQSVVFGGGDQEFGLRGGTQNVPAIVGMGEACRTALPHVGSARTLKDVFLMVLQKNCGCVRKNVEPNWSHILSLRFDGIDAETLVLALSERGVCASSGAACSGREVEPSHVLTAIGLTEEQARSTVRFSFSNKNTVEEVIEAAIIVADSVSELQHLGGVM